MSDTLKDRIVGRTWSATHGRSSAGSGQSYRTSVDAAPTRSRGGASTLVFNGDNTFAMVAPGPDDRPRQQQGKWAVVDGRIELSLEGSSTRATVEVTAADDEIVLTFDDR